MTIDSLGALDGVVSAYEPSQAEGLGVPEGWHPEGLMAGVSEMNAAAAQSGLPAVMSPEQMADVDWSGGGEDVPVPTPRPPYVTISGGGDAGALTQDVQSLDPRLSPLLGQLHWVAVPNSIDQDDEAHIDPNEIPRGYPTTGDDSQLTLGDLDGLYEPNVKHVIIAIDGGNIGDGSYNTVFHETGHGIDVLKNKLGESSEDAFTKAYNGDKPLMTPGEDDYYLNTKSGPSESYAESFSRYFGGDPTLQQDWPNMYGFWAQRYPNVQPGQKWKWSEQ